MVQVTTGDIFESGAQTIVNTVNTEGVMGKGLALQFSKRFPEMYQDYVRRCENGEVKLGQPYLYRGLLEPWILNFPTKQHWRSVSKLADIEQGLTYLADHCKQWGIESLAVPPLGCGHGGLEWTIVGPVIYRHLKTLDIPVTFYAPTGSPPEMMSEQFFKQAQEEPRPDPHLGAWVAIAEIVNRLMGERYRTPLSRTSFQKVAYFATEVGIPTGLIFDQGSYGPFSAQLKPYLTKMVNNGLVTESTEDHGNAFRVNVGPSFSEARQMQLAFLAGYDRSIDRIADLFLRLRTAHEAEIAATVHFVASRLALQHSSKPTESEVLDGVAEWKKRRKPPLKDDEVAAMIRNLGILGWVNLSYSDDLPVPADIASV